MHRLLIPALVIVASCYQPRADDACALRCDPASVTPCPSGLACGRDGRCFQDVECSMIGTDGGGTDTPPDMPMLDENCVQTLLLGKVCPSVFQTAATYPQDGTLVDTDVDAACTETLFSPTGDVCLIAAENIVISDQTLRIHGSRPIAFFGRNQITIAGPASLDVSMGGAGASVMCDTPAGRSQQSTTDAAGGGAGGTMAGRGGDGGAPTGFPAVLAKLASPITTLRGGCPGGAGGSNNSNTGGGLAGPAGGAIQLISPGTVTILGSINAFGGGGGGGQAGGLAAGGGGGGSGGLIAIDAGKIVVGANGILRAHGGGGGGGAAATGTGSTGNPAVATDGSAANGGPGMGGANNGPGGMGSSDGANASPGGATLSSSAGAGGGGGGAGAIVFRAAEPLDIAMTSKIHPPPGPTP